MEMSEPTCEQRRHQHHAHLETLEGFSQLCCIRLRAAFKRDIVDCTQQRYTFSPYKQPYPHAVNSPRRYAILSIGHISLSLQSFCMHHHEHQTSTLLRKLGGHDDRYKHVVYSADQ